MKTYLSLIFLVTSALIYSQNPLTIGGKVKSEEGIISDAYVTIGTQGGITDESGLFEFEYKSLSIPNKLRIEVSAIGYRTRQFYFLSKDSNFKDSVATLSLFPEIDDSSAHEDIKNGIFRLLLSGGIAPVIYKSDKKFTRKYGITFYEFGCEVIAIESMKRYNAVVGQYLDMKYVKKWRKKIRDDVVGIN